MAAAVSIQHNGRPGEWWARRKIQVLRSDPVMRLRGGGSHQRPWEGEKTMPDYYAELGVAAGATDKELRQAHKRMMLKYHPDKNAGSRVAQERFLRVQVRQPRDYAVNKDLVCK
jgi:DnaJ-domain-containing protein 1